MKKISAACFMMFLLFITCLSAIAAAESDEVSIPSSGREGEEIQVYFIKPEGDVELEKIVVLISNYPDNHSEDGGFDVIANGLAENGILAAELAFAGNTPSEMCADVLDVINYARDNYQVDQVGALGYAMGARVIAQMMINDMFKFDSIVFISPALDREDLISGYFGGQDNYDSKKTGIDPLYPPEFFTDLESNNENMIQLAAEKYQGNSLTIYSQNDTIAAPGVSHAAADAFGSSVIAFSDPSDGPVNPFKYNGKNSAKVNAMNVAIVTFFVTDLNKKITFQPQ